MKYLRWIVSGLLLACFLGLSAYWVQQNFMQRPKTIGHAEAQYVLRPGTTRAGLARTIVNSHHMRAAEADTYPVLFVGDSVILGWARIDQNHIATSILSNRLQLPVGNASANSWGPPNQLGYLRAFGLFDAKIVVLVLSSHDASDIPGHKADKHKPHPDAISALREMLTLIQANSAVPILVLHLEQDELEAVPAKGHFALRDVAEEMGAPVLVLQITPDAYFDQIHPNRHGQSQIADQLEPIIKEKLSFNQVHSQAH